MIEVEALNFIDTFKSYDTFRSEEKAILITKYSALVGTTTDDEFESIYKDTYDFVMQTIYNYYEGYYLTSPTKDRFLSLLGTIVSGKLPAYKVRYDNYINARNMVYDNLTSRESSSSSTGSETGSGEQNYKNNKSGSRSSSGSSKYADTPENINASEDFVDEYTTGQSKDSSSSSHTDTSTTDTNFSNSRSKTGNKSYNETLKGGAKQLWENVQSIPSEIYKEVITITAKLFFSEIMEERSYPLAYKTLTRKVEELEEQESKSGGVLGYESILNDECVLHTTILTTSENYETWTDFSRYILSAISTTYDEETHKVQTEWSFRNGMSANDTYTLPLSSLTTDGLMSKEQYSKLDQVVLYGTNYATSGRNFAVKQDADHDLYVYLPEDSSYTLPIASASVLGGIKVGSNLTIDSTGKLSAVAGSYTLPIASASVLGGVKIGNNLTITSDGTLSSKDTIYTLPNATSTILGGIKLGFSATGKNYPVQVDANNNAYVYVNWTDYVVATQSSNGLMSASDKTKLDGLSNVSYEVDDTNLEITLTL